MFVPGIVLSLAWTLGTLIAVDQGENPLTALVRSNEVTYGKKWTIFLAYLVLGIVVGVAVFILSAVIGAVSEGLAMVVVFLAVAASVSFFISALGYIYYTLDGGSAE